MLVFVTAFGLLLGVDGFVRRDNQPIAREPNAPAGARTSYPSLATAAFAAILMLGAALAAPQLKPVRAEGPAHDLQSLVPQAFGDWSIDPSVVPVPATPDVQEKLDRIYSETLSRTYVNARGEQMMLTLAYGGDQSDALKAHRQEVCYTAQGFAIHGLEQGDLAAAGRSIPVTRMLAVRAERSEPVTYWFTMGDRVVRGRLERLQMQLTSGLRGRIPDGMLVRVSSISADPPAAFAAQQSFMAALLGAMPPEAAARLVGGARS
jgi:EpsI family protein